MPAQPPPPDYPSPELAELPPAGKRTISTRTKLIATAAVGALATLITVVWWTGRTFTMHGTVETWSRSSVPALSQASVVLPSWSEP